MLVWVPIGPEDIKAADAGFAVIGAKEKASAIAQEKGAGFIEGGVDLRAKVDGFGPLPAKEDGLIQVITAIATRAIAGEEKECILKEVTGTFADKGIVGPDEGDDNRSGVRVVAEGVDEDFSFQGV